MTDVRLDFMQIVKLMSLIADARAKGGVSICLGVRHFALVCSVQLLQQMDDYILADMETGTDDTDSSWQATQLISESKQKRCN